MKENKLVKIFGIGALASVVLGIVGIILAIVLDVSVVLKVFLILSGILFMILAVELGYMFLLSRDTKPNYFLYNPNTNSNMTKDKLSLSLIQTKMNDYLRTYAGSIKELWEGRVLDTPYLEMTEEFIPIVAYKMLYDVVNSNSAAAWTCFGNASGETVEFVAKGLEASNLDDIRGEQVLAAKLRELASNIPIDVEDAKSYFADPKKKAFLENHMVEYVRLNIDKFSK